MRTSDPIDIKHKDTEEGAECICPETTFNGYISCTFKTVILSFDPLLSVHLPLEVSQQTTTGTGTHGKECSCNRNRKGGNTTNQGFVSSRYSREKETRRVCVVGNERDNKRLQMRKDAEKALPLRTSARSSERVRDRAYVFRV